MTLRLRVLLGMAVFLGCARDRGRVDTLAFIDPVVAVDHGYAWHPDDGPRAVADHGADLPVRDVVYTDPGEVPQLLAGGVVLPLRNTDVRAHVRGMIAEVVVKQRFVNDNRVILDAVYTFPLPENSAVTDMRMVVGERVIEAEIQERAKAEQIYRLAQAAGHTAALLEQERPNVFTQSLANIPPGEAVDIEIRYLQTVSYDSGEYEFVFPTVVGERYLPGTDRVPDAARISPPTMGRGVRTGNDLSIHVTAEAGAPITAWAAPAHDVTALATGPRLEVALARRDEIPNRDFVLRYRSAGAQPGAKLFLGTGEKDGGHFALVVDPPRLDVDALVGRRELIFVVDVSGSMNGRPLALAKAAMRDALTRARPVDTFDVITFAGRTARLFGSPRPVNADSLRQAHEFVDGLSAGGGTEMAAAVDEALREKVEDGRHRYVFFMTDGHIGEEDTIARGARELIARQRAEGRRARVFGVGIGDAPNEHLIATLSKVGEGAPLDIRLRADLPRAGQIIERIIDAPVLTDIAVDWGGLGIRDLSNTTPDLFASHPYVLYGRYSGDARHELRLRGRVGEHSVTIPIEVVVTDEADRVLSRLWARDKIGALDLSRATHEAPESVVGAEILALGLRHHLVTQFTSLVAVDRSRTISGPRVDVTQPVDLPPGVDPNLAVAVRNDAAKVVRLDALRNIPVGGTSRDFTAVVELSPTSSRDSAGIRLGGSTGAEARYVVQGSNTTAPAFGTVGATIVQEFIETAEFVDGQSTHPGRGFAPVETYARTRIRSVSAPHPDEATALQKRLRGDGEALARCFVHADPATYRIRRGLVLVIHTTPAGGIARMEVRAKSPMSEQLATCLRQRIDPLLRGTITKGGRIEIDLSVWMRF